jgi:energy-coupling factor transporter transmembrane protein EcfT
MIKRTIVFLSLAFVVTLAVVLGTRMSADALAVIVGVILGIVASIPTVFVVVFALTRRQSHLDRLGSASPQPPIVIVNGTEKAQGQPQAALPSPYLHNGNRKWTVIGDEGLDD